MKIERRKEWWVARARREGDAAVGAGLLAFDPVSDERPTTIAQTAGAEENRIAFGEASRDMAASRRRRQIAQGRLKRENGLQV